MVLVSTVISSPVLGLQDLLMNSKDVTWLGLSLRVRLFPLMIVVAQCGA